MVPKTPQVPAPYSILALVQFMGSSKLLVELRTN